MVEYAEFLSVSVAGAATYSESILNVPTPRLGGGFGRSSYGRRTATAMVIHSIEIETQTAASATTADVWTIQLTKQSKTDEVYLTDGDVIAKFSNAVVTSLSVQTGQVGNMIYKYDFKVPVLVAGQKLFVGQKCTASAGNLYMRITYTMREVDEADLVRQSVV